MIAHISGKLIYKSPAQVVIECSGVGYSINISLNTYSQLKNNESCRLLTHLSIKEDSHQLYGFADEEERALFRQLISVSGIGTATGIMILSSISPLEIKKAILNADVDLLRSIKGIGPKTAQRMILELKDKIKLSAHEVSKDGFGSLSSLSPQMALKNEAISALQTLGFPRNTVEKVLNDVLHQSTGTLSVEELIKIALKQL